VNLNLKKPVKLPTPVLAHCLAYGPRITQKSLRISLEHSQRLGYSGLVIVPAIIEEGFTPHAVTKMFKEMGMTGLVCGFNPGNGPDPLHEEGRDMAIEFLGQQAQYAIALADEGIGPAMMVGPMQTLHMKERSTWPADGFRRWMQKCAAFSAEFGLFLAFEPLNRHEDGTPKPFWTIFDAIKDQELLGLHVDIGHADANGMTVEDLKPMAHKVGYLEFANRGRWPLQQGMGIDFPTCVAGMTHLHDHCQVGNEPFDGSVIKTFGLGRICTTEISGQECLRREVRAQLDKGREADSDLRVGLS
jgi:hypothetical protein